MGDIDFDELDKAVNSLMGKGNANQPVNQEEKPLKTLKLNETAVSSPKQIEEAAKKITGGQDTSTVKSISLDSTPVPSRQSTGRFMDVMHPSADMRASSGVPKPPARTTAPVRPSVVPLASSTPEMKPQTTSSASATADTTSFSPFLPDAKVEKRPLGSAPTIGAVPSPFGNKSPEETDAKPKQERADVSPVNSEPLQTDDTAEQNEEPTETVPINSEDRPKGDMVHDNQRSFDAADFVKGQTPEERQLQQLESNEVKASAPAPDEEKVRSVESGDTERIKSGGGIYNVDSLKHPVKQKSGWLTVVVIVVIVLVCAGLGAAAFFTIGPGA